MNPDVSYHRGYNAGYNDAYATVQAAMKVAADQGRPYSSADIHPGRLTWDKPLVLISLAVQFILLIIAVSAIVTRC